MSCDLYSLRNATDKLRRRVFSFLFCQPFFWQWPAFLLIYLSTKRLKTVSLETAFSQTGLPREKKAVPVMKRKEIQKICLNASTSTTLPDSLLFHLSLRGILNFSRPYLWSTSTSHAFVRFGADCVIMLHNVVGQVHDSDNLTQIQSLVFHIPRAIRNLNDLE